MKIPNILLKCVVNCFVLFSFSLPTLAQGTISSYYLEKEIELMAGPVVEANRIVLYTLGENVSGYYGWASQGEEVYHITGKIFENKITGNKFSLFDGKSSPVTLTLGENAVSLESPVGPVTVPAVNQDLFSEAPVTIHESPSFASKIILNKQSIKGRGFTIIEIGKMSKSTVDPVGFNIWYKIKNAETEGWVFGLLNIF